MNNQQNRVYDYLKLVGGVDVPAYEVGIKIYGTFFTSYKLQIASATRVLTDLHRLGLVVKNYSYTHNCDVWSIKAEQTEI